MEISTLAIQLSAAKDAVCSSGATGPSGGGITAPGLIGSGASGAIVVGSTMIAAGALFSLVSATVLIW